MGPVKSLFSRHHGPPWAAHATTRTASQKIVLSGQVVETLSRYRQRHPCSLEAGGQLFGQVTSDVVAVVHASHPSRHDTRTRYSFRSAGKNAQHRVIRLSTRSLHYLGEWHTHPQVQPRPSSDDRQAMRALHRRSVLSVTELVMIIVSSSGECCRWYIESSNSSGRVLLWDLE